MKLCTWVVYMWIACMKTLLLIAFRSSWFKVKLTVSKNRRMVFTQELELRLKYFDETLCGKPSLRKVTLGLGFG